MQINTHQEENYLHVSIEGKYDENNWDSFTSLISEEDNPQIWIIMEFTEEEVVMQSEMVHALTELNAYCSEEGGLLILIGGKEKVEKAAEVAEILVIPSLDEAIDYIFIEQLEKDFGLED